MMAVMMVLVVNHCTNSAEARMEGSVKKIVYQYEAIQAINSVCNNSHEMNIGGVVHSLDIRDLTFL